MRLTIKVTKDDIETAINLGLLPIDVAIEGVLIESIRANVADGNLLLSYYQMSLSGPHIIPLTDTASAPPTLESGKPRSPFKVQLCIPATMLNYETRMAVNRKKKQKRHESNVPAGI